MNSQINTRNVILDILIEVLEKGEYSNKVLSMALRKYQYISKEDRAFISQVTLGTVERLISIDYIIGCFSSVKVKKMKPVIRNIIRMATYQLVFMEKADDYAACNEAVKLAGKRGFRSLSGFVNGVLRNISREKNNIKYPNKAVEYSMPEWIYSMWCKNYGEDVAHKMLEAQYAKRALAVRCNTRHCSSNVLTEQLAAEGVIAKVYEDILEAIMIEDLDYLGKVEAFNEGDFWVQDLSSMLVSRVADAAFDWKVLDMCAAPGGKSLGVAMSVTEGNIISCDVSDNKVELIEDNIDRLGIDNIDTKVWDATEHNADWDEAFDLVIADVPCSGLGILAKKPDIKYNASEQGILDLQALQRQILTNAVTYVKHGGVLMFSTCTLNHYENIDNVKWLCENFDFELKDFSDRVPNNLYNNTSKDGYLEILPGMNKDYDGFFLAKLVRK